MRNTAPEKKTKALNSKQASSCKRKSFSAVSQQQTSRVLTSKKSLLLKKFTFFKPKRRNYGVELKVIEVRERKEREKRDNLNTESENFHNRTCLTGFFK